MSKQKIVGLIMMSPLFVALGFFLYQEPVLFLQVIGAFVLCVTVAVGGALFMDVK